MEKPNPEIGEYMDFGCVPDDALAGTRILVRAPFGVFEAIPGKPGFNWKRVDGPDIRSFIEARGRYWDAVRDELAAGKQLT